MKEDLELQLAEWREIYRNVTDEELDGYVRARFNAHYLYEIKLRELERKLGVTFESKSELTRKDDGLK